MNRVIDICFPHVAKFAQWEELKYALRSIEKNYRGEARIWIIGDKPRWLSKEANFIKVAHTGLSPRPDVMHKIKAVIDNEDIGEEFFWTNDDIYFINPVTYADMCLPKVHTSLDVKVRRIQGIKTVYHTDIVNTYEELLLNGYPTLNYSTHTPFRFEKAKMQELIDRFNLLEERLLPENLYYNIYHGDELPYYLELKPTNNQLFSINRPNPNWNAINENLLTKKWMNNSEAGMSERVQKLLMELFPEKSRWEK